MTVSIREHERRDEEALLTKIAELADAGGRGVLGLEATLAAISDGQVHELAVADGVSASGWECPDCAGTSPRAISTVVRGAG